MGTAQYTLGMQKMNTLTMAHQWIEGVLMPGDTAIDATVGNGHDTLFLARCVGENGKVYGFDIQASALASAQERLKAESQSSQVTLLEHGHEDMLTVLPKLETESVKAIMFNLGYLPGHDTKDLITRPETTLRALENATKFLTPGGLITLVLYTGHPGGEEEAQAVTTWASVLDQHRFSVVRYETINQHNNPPFLIAITKKSGALTP